MPPESDNDTMKWWPWRTKESPRIGPAHLPLPRLLVDLVMTGQWQQAAAGWRDPARIDALRSLLPASPVESELHLLSPPFRTVQEDITVAAREGDSFYEDCWALDQIDPARAVVFADFEIGADTALILDYREGPTEPTVRYLQWSAAGPENNRWVTIAPNFAAFADAIGL